MTTTGATIRRVISTMLGPELSNQVRRHYQAFQLERGAYDGVEAETALLPRWLGAGDIAIDVGANIGVYTRLLSRLVGATGRVFAFEPVASTYQTLTHNVSRLPHRNVVTFHAAVSAQTGVGEIDVPTKGLQSIYRAHLRYADAATDGDRLLVQTLALDDLLPVVPRLDLLKCDVEGAEMYVLRGAEQLLVERRPKIVIEIKDDARRFGTDPREIFAWLHERGWDSFFLREGELQPTSGPAEANPGPNYVFLPR